MRKYLITISVVYGLSSAQAGLLFGQSPRDYRQANEIAQLQLANEEWRPTAAQVLEVQLFLLDLGFDPGKPDGKIGQQTTAAIEAFQRSINLEVDGNLTKEVYEEVLSKYIKADSSSTSSTQSEGSEKVVPVGPQTQQIGLGCLPGAIGVWQFEDTNGARFTLILQEGGSVDGPVYPDHWRWRSIDEGIEISYDNGMGMTVTRRGRLEGNSLLTGEAADSRERTWTWIAERLHTSPGGENSNCPPMESK